MLKRSFRNVPVVRSTEPPDGQHGWRPSVAAQRLRSGQRDTGSNHRFDAASDSGKGSNWPARSRMSTIWLPRVQPGGRAELAPFFVPGCTAVRYALCYVPHRRQCLSRELSGRYRRVLCDHWNRSPSECQPRSAAIGKVRRIRVRAEPHQSKARTGVYRGPGSRQAECQVRRSDRGEVLHEGRASRLTGSPIAAQEGDPTEPMRDVIYKVDFRSRQPDFCGIAMVRNDVFKRVQSRWISPRAGQHAGCWSRQARLFFWARYHLVLRRSPLPSLWV